MAQEIQTISNIEDHQLITISSTSNNLSNNGNNNNSVNSNNNTERKERKGSSYVWIYCDKLSRHSIRCKLCDKVMSFHGTANVITHLQRKHNIMGKPDNSAAEPFNDTIRDDTSTKELEDEGKYKNRPGYVASSIVWKHCKRLSKDVVRCGFCKKNLSYQGTSNLQRHLHRMHGVVSRGRAVKATMSEDDEDDFDGNNEFIWEFCTTMPENQIKCNLCSDLFETKEKIRKHLTVLHAIKPPKDKQPVFTYSDESQNEGSNDNCYFANFRKTNDINMEVDYDEGVIKKDDTLFDELIEEDNEHQNNYDEHPFDTNLLHEMRQANPLSPPTSTEHSPHREFQHKSSFKNSKMQKLYEEKMRVETEYFREKAAYYKMQKYLAALQAKKVRVELERITSSQLNDTSFTVGDSLTNNLTT